MRIYNQCQLVDEPEPQQQAPSIIEDTLPLEPGPQAPSIIDDTLPLNPEPQHQEPSIIDDTLTHASTLAEESEPQPQPQLQQEASSTTDELQQDLSTLVEFLVRKQDQTDVEQAQLPQHESTTIEEPAIVQPMSTLVLETFLQEQELTLVEDPQPQPQHLLRQELLRRHGIVECHFQVQPLRVEDDVQIIAEVMPRVHRRKRKSSHNPTYNPSRRRESIVWGETSELASHPNA